MSEGEQIANLGGFGYAFASAGYLVLAILLLTSWRGRIQGALLLAVAVVSSVWAAWVSFTLFYALPISLFHIWLELLKDGCALLFLFKLLLSAPKSKKDDSSSLKLFAYVVLVVWLALVVGHTVFSLKSSTFVLVGYTPMLIGHTLLTVVGLILVEQLFRNTHPQERWALKFMCLGFGGLFAYDFFMYSSGVLFGALDIRHWEARGYIHMLIVPLIAVSAARNPQWSVDLFVSRRMVFHSAAILGTGIYLLLMALGGYAISYLGGGWGRIAQLVFLFAAVVVLVALMFSGQVRAYLKVFLSKHFFNYRYDYRDEWLKLISSLESEGATGTAIRERAIQSLANIVESPGGALWLESENNRYLLAESWNYPRALESLSRDTFTSYLETSQWLIDVNEYRENPEIYGGLRLPDWLEQSDETWLVIPMFQAKSLFGFIILLQPRVQRNINWEDRDLIKTAATQVASYLALSEASAELADARQFEAFNRLSAYVVHDLKNVVGQLSLVVSNSKKFSDNKAFVEDAFATVDNAVNKMQKMLAQLRQGRAVEQRAKAVKLLPIVQTVVEKRAVGRPCPLYEPVKESFRPYVVAEGDRLEAVIEHIVQNAQEATSDEGSVIIRVLDENGCAVVEVEDSGCGMDREFIRNRLFRPFDTTKGNAGMGIGVYESREFIRALGGDVLVNSEPGIGSVFRLRIPVSEGREQGRDI